MLILRMILKSMNSNRLALTLLFTLTYLTSLGQSGEVTALRQRLNSAQGKERVVILNQLTEQVKGSLPKQATLYAEEAFELSGSVNYPEGRMSSAYFLGLEERKAGRFGKAAKYIEEGIIAAQAAGNPDRELKGLEYLAGIYQASKRPKKLKDAQLRYSKLRNQLLEQNSSEELASLEKEVRQKESALNRSESERKLIEGELIQTREEKLIREGELDRLGREKAELELRAEKMEHEVTQNKLEISQQENEILNINSRLKRQQFQKTLVSIGLLAVLIILFLLIRYMQLRRVHAEEKITAQRQLLMQEKMATLGQLTAGIAHEIKNPLNFVNNFAEGSTEITEELEESILAQKEKIKGEQLEQIQDLIDELKQNSQDILSNGKRADRIVLSMMEHARGDKGTPQPTNINILVRENLNLAYLGYRALNPGFDIHIEEVLDESIEPIQLIPQDISRVLLNIFNNACFALHKKKEENQVDFEPTIQVNTRKEQNELIISIRDNGQGIPAHLQEKIFTPFFTTKPTGEGNTGLGLSISYDIVVQGHQGTLTVDSQPGSFSEFIISLPIKG